MNTITIHTQGNHWMAIHEGPHAVDIRSLFGTVTLPTAFTIATPAAEVLATLARLHPGMTVVEMGAPVPQAPRNPHRIGLRAALSNAGMDLDECDDTEVPACCSEDCFVEPDGYCEHGCPSVLLAAGVI